MGRKFDMIIGVVGTIAAVYVLNGAFCSFKISNVIDKKLASSTYNQYILTLEDLKCYNKVLDSGLLSYETKKNFEDEIKELTIQKQNLEYNLKEEYDKKIEEWKEKQRNPFKPFKHFQ